FQADPLGRAALLDLGDLHAGRIVTAGRSREARAFQGLTVRELGELRGGRFADQDLEIVLLAALAGTNHAEVNSGTNGQHADAVAKIALAAERAAVHFD